MKKGTAAAIALSAAVIAALIGLTVYLSVQFRADMTNTNQENAEALSVAEDAMQRLYSDPADQDLLPADPAGAEEEPLTEGVWQKDFPDTPVIWSGDSRTVGVQRAVKNNTDDFFVAASGEGYEWLYDTGVVQVEDLISSYPDLPVIFNFGVNDYENLENYLSLYEAITEAHPDTVFYFLSVNPIDPKECSAITNEEIEQFNAQIAAVYPDCFLDSYHYLEEVGCEIVDGIHYSENTYRTIYQFVKKSIAA